MSLARLPRRVVSLAPPARSPPRRAPAARPLRAALGAPPSAPLSELRYCPESDAFVSEALGPASADASALVARARAHYEREGWLVVRGVASAARVADLQAAADALEARAALLTSSRRIEGAWFETQSASGKKGDAAARPGALRKITSPSKLERAFRDLRELRPHRARRDGALRPGGGHTRSDRPGVRGGSDQRESRENRHRVPVAPGRLLFETAREGRVRSKRRRERRPRARPVRRDERRVRGLIANAPNPRAARREGPVRHPRGNRRDSRGGRRDETASFFDESGRRLEPLDPGDAIFFHPMLAHGSGRNVSGRRRRVATLWYVGKDEEDTP